MYLGNYYDEVLKEAGLKGDPAEEAVEEAKIAEVIEALEKQGTAFDSNETAAQAINQVIEDDYAEKVASVCNEFDTDGVAFSSDEEKVASAMEIVDGWERLVVTSAKR